MAIARATHTSSIEGLQLQIEYNEANLRMTRVFWNLPSGVVWVRIWNSGNLVIDRTIVGPATGEENIPGNFRMVTILDDDGSQVLTLPPELTYSFEIVNGD